MGYRSFTAGTTKGTVNGGSEDINVFKEVILLGYLRRLYQKTVTITYRCAGISLANAQSAHASSNLKHHQITQGAGQSVSWCVVPCCVGSKTRVNYSQVGDSNLYVLNTEETTLSVSENGSTWDTTGNVT